MYHEAIEYLCMDEALFGIDSLVTRIVYLLVGLSGLYLIFLYPKIASRD